MGSVVLPDWDAGEQLRRCKGAAFLLRTPCLTTPRLSIAGMLQFGRLTGSHQLLRFSIVVHVRLVDGSPHRREKRVAARRVVHIP